MEKQDDLSGRLPVRKHMENMKKVVGLVHGLDRRQFPMAAAAEMLMTAGSYLQLILTAGVLNRLEEAAGWTQIAGFAGGLILGIFGCRVLEGWLRKRLKIRRDAIASGYQMLMSKKMMQMDFSLVNSPMLDKIKNRIRQDNGWGAGIHTIFWTSDWLFGSVFRLAGAVMLVVPMLPEMRQTGSWTAAIVLLLILAGILAYARTKVKMNAKWNDMMASMFYYSDPGERVQKADLIYEMMTESGFPYQSGKDVRIYSAYRLFEEYTAGRLSRFLHPKFREGDKQLGKMAMVTDGGNTLLSSMPYFLVAYIALSGSLQTGSLLQYAGALGNVVVAVGGMISAIGEIALASRRQLSTLELLELQDEMYKGKLPVEKRSDYEYEIEFSHVWFRYPGAEDYALKDFSLKLRIGEKLAIVGMNGSGKTTMIKLLCRLYEPQEGQILLNGVDIRKFREDEYRRLFSVVFQDFSMFPLKLGENVAGASAFEEQRVHRCLEDAGFGRRLESLADGMETYLYKSYDDSGVEISGGEAQKIAIARALYKEAPFILLDEPTAALDPKAEYEIYAGFDKIVGKKTAIYISHRLSSCRFCDDIAVFDEGRLVQRGSHEELVKDEKGKYFELWSAQAKYYA